MNHQDIQKILALVVNYSQYRSSEEYFLRGGRAEKAALAEEMAAKTYNEIKQALEKLVNE